MEIKRNKKERMLTMLSARNFEYKDKVPCITLSGKWLKACGFEPGDKVKVLNDQYGSVRVRRVQHSEMEGESTQKNKTLIQLHDCRDETPTAEGCYLVVVKEEAQVIFPEIELDSLIKIPGGIYYSIADWDGEEWTNIHFNCDIYSLEEEETFHVCTLRAAGVDRYN